MQPKTRNRKQVPSGGADPTLESDAGELLEALTRLVRVYQFRDRNRICCHDISVTQCYALQSVVRQEGMTQRELAAELYLDKSTLSRVVRSLVRKGYLRAASDPVDRRSIRLAATPAGRGLLARIERDLLAEQAQLVADFAPEVRRATAKLMSRLARATADRMLGSGSTGRGRGAAPACCNPA